MSQPSDETRDLSIPEDWKGEPPTLEADEPETRVLKGRTVTGEKPTECIHDVPLQRGFWCGDCQDSRAKAQAEADRLLRERRARERAERGL